jgi:hypothetical protein
MPIIFSQLYPDSMALYPDSMAFPANSSFSKTADLPGDRALAAHLLIVTGKCDAGGYETIILIETWRDAA